MKNIRPVFHKSTINTDPAVEEWLGSQNASDDESIREYIIHHKRSIEEMIFWEDKVAWMQNYLTVRKDFIERSIDKRIKRDYAYLDVIDSLIQRAIEENCMQIRAWLVEYKNRTFGNAFMDEAEADQFDLEFELRDPLPAEKHAVGEELRLGSYCYDVSGQKRDIVWQVLDIIEDRALIVSREVLAFKRFNEDWGRMTWENCSLRKWLNEDFLQTAFTEEERHRIARGSIRNRKNDMFGTDAGPDTEDSVFLLSMEEAREYYTSDEDRQVMATPYAAAEAGFAGDAEAAPWRLRTPGYKGGCYNAYIRTNGMINTHGCFNDQDGFGIRPAMWVKLKNEHQ